MLRRAGGLFSSILLWGPPESGKTSLVIVIAKQTKSQFETLSDELAGGPKEQDSAELKKVIDKPLEL